MTYAVTAIGTDQPGIVAAVTGVLVDHGCNLEDTAMTILRGEFAMVMVVAPASGSSPAALELALNQATESFGLLINVRELPPGRTSAMNGSPWTVVVHGADRPGIVHGIAAALAGAGGNITDLKTQVSGDLYVMVIEVVVPDGADLTGVEAAAAELGVTCTAHPADVDIL